MKQDVAKPMGVKGRVREEGLLLTAAGLLELALEVSSFLCTELVLTSVAASEAPALNKGSLGSGSGAACRCRDRRLCSARTRPARSAARWLVA